MDAQQYNKIVATNLKFLREERNMTMQQLADACGNVAKSLIGKIEKNIHEVVHSKRISNEVISSLEKGLPAVEPGALTSSNDNLWDKINLVEKTLASNNLELVFNNKTLPDTIFSILSLASGCGPHEKARAYFIKAEYEYQRGNYKLSLMYNQFGMNMAQNWDDSYLMHRARFLLSKSLHMTGDNKAVLEILQADLLEWKKSEDNGKSLYLKGLAHLKIKEYDEAISAFKNACELFAGQPRLVLFIGRCYQCLGDAYLAIGEFEESVRYSESALEIARKHDDLVSEIYILKTIGEAWFSKEDRITAAAFFEEALIKANGIKKIRNLEVVKLEYSLGRCTNDYGRTKKAVHEMSSAQGPVNEYIEALLELAKMARERHLTDDAFYFYEKAIQKLRD